MASFIPFNRDQAFLLPPDLKSWLPDDDLAHFVVAARGGGGRAVPFSAFVVPARTGGKPQYHPRLMLALLIHCYANGIFSSRRIERATWRDIAVRFVAANLHPDHDTGGDLPAVQQGRHRGGFPAGPAAGARDRAAAAGHGVDRRHQDRRQRLQDTLHTLRPGSAITDQAGKRHCRSDGPGRSGRRRDPRSAGTHTIGLPTTVLADTGYASGSAVAALEEHGVEPLVAIGRTQPHRPYDVRPPREPKAPRRITEPWRIAMKAKLESDDGRSRYKMRKQTVEPVFGIIKSAIGFTRFRLRGLANAATEWSLVTLAYNCRRIARLRAA